MIKLVYHREPELSVELSEDELDRLRKVKQEGDYFMSKKRYTKVIGEVENE